MRAPAACPPHDSVARFPLMFRLSCAILRRDGYMYGMSSPARLLKGEGLLGRQPRARWTSTDGASAPPAVVLSTHRKRSITLAGLATSAGIIFVSAGVMILISPLVDTFLLPWVIKRAMLYNGGSPPPPGSIAAHHDPIFLRQEELDALCKMLAQADGLGEKAAIVVSGAPSTGKSSIARRLHSASGRPGVYISFRHCESLQEALYAVLYYLLEPVGLMGRIAIGYVKILNALVDAWSMNQGHEHVSSVFMSQILGHARLALLDIAVNHKEVPLPLLILDNVQVLVNAASNGNRAAADVMHALDCLAMAAVLDEASCHLVVLGDSAIVGDVSSLSSLSPEPKLYSHMPTMKDRLTWTYISTGLSRDRTAQLLEQHAPPQCAGAVRGLLDGVRGDGYDFTAVRRLVTVLQKQPRGDASEPVVPSFLSPVFNSSAATTVLLQQQLSALLFEPNVPIGELVDVLKAFSSHPGPAVPLLSLLPPTVDTSAAAGAGALIAAGLATLVTGSCLSTPSSPSHGLALELHPSLLPQALDLSQSYVPVSVRLCPPASGSAVMKGLDSLIYPELHAAITLWLKDFTPEEVSAGVSSALHPPVGKGRYPLSSTNGFGIGRKGWEAQTPPNGAQNGTSGPSGGPMGPSFRHILTPGDVKSLVRPDVTLRPAGMRL